MSIQDEAKAITAKIVENYKPEKVILFGSVVRGDTNKSSDIDLLIIKKTIKKRPFRAKQVYEAIRGFNRKYPLDLIVYTPREIKNRLALGDYFVKEAFSGKILYESK